MPIDYRNYNPEWKMLRELISHRDRNRCRWCKAPHRVRIWRHKSGAWTPLGPNVPPNRTARIILCVCTVAHLDHDRTNDNPQNLALLCQRCHLNHDRPQHLAKQRAHRITRPPRPRPHPFTGEDTTL